MKRGLPFGKRRPQTAGVCASRRIMGQKVRQSRTASKHQNRRNKARMSLKTKDRQRRSATHEGSADLLLRSAVRGKRRGVRPQISKEVSGSTEGALIRSIGNTGRVWGNRMTAKVLWQIAREAASRARTEKPAPHDLGDCLQGQVGIHYASGEFWKPRCRLRTSGAFRGEQCWQTLAATDRLRSRPRWLQ